MLDNQTFEIVINSTPLISIDFLVKKNNEYLLGKRINRPAKGFLFTIGGRIRKNETVQGSMSRIAREELNLDLKLTPRFVGIFEHFFEDSIYQATNTHYVNLAYEFEIQDALNLPTEQHNEYQWLTTEELLMSSQVHKYVKNYFNDNKHDR